MSTIFSCKTHYTTCAPTSDIHFLLSMSRCCPLILKSSFRYTITPHAQTHASQMCFGFCEPLITTYISAHVSPVLKHVHPISEWRHRATSHVSDRPARLVHKVTHPRTRPNTRMCAHTVTRSLTPQNEPLPPLSRSFPHNVSQIRCTPVFVSEKMPMASHRSDRRL